ncbi:MAG: amidohydrolase family protein [Syntrophobacterales bacterium]|jgi:adenine deaminase|nr:amidohydrolase family protein [Syntrophobacterales bacterium]
MRGRATKKEQLRTLIDVVKGSVTPDVVIRNGRVVNVFTNEIQDGLMIVIKDGIIVSIEEDRDVPFYAGATVIDGEGQYLCPGFIDAHTHIDAVYLFNEFVPYAIRGGTTTVVTETTMIGTSCGMIGLLSYLDSTKGYPLKCYFVAPPLTPPFPKMEGAKGITFKEFSTLLKRDDCLGIGEAYWTKTVEGEERILKQVALALSLGKRIDGHSAGARGKNLTRYLLTGVTSCHESIQMDEVVEKLRFGLYVMIREGFVRQELPELHKIKDLAADKRRAMLVSDSFDAVMLLNDGYLDSIARKAIAHGFSPMEAVKMVTINPADYLGLRHVGAIAPLRHADIVFLKDFEKVSVDRVMADGKIVFAGESFMGEAPRYRFPGHAMNTVQADKVTADDFMVKARGKDSAIRVIQVASPTITREITYKPTVKNGFLEKNLAEDIIPVAVINRNKGKKIGRGFIKGTGIKDGAIATTIIWDSCNILTLGSSEEDLKEVVNRLIDMKGGIAISKHGKIIYELPMPVFGLMSLAGMKEIAEETKKLEEKLKEIGVSFEKPLLAIQTIPFTGLPFLRITDKGLADIRNRKLVSLFLQEDR